MASGATYGVIVPSLLVDHLPDAITHLIWLGLVRSVPQSLWPIRWR